MTINEIEAKSILRKHKRIDSWFISAYGMNLYRGCLHDCVYCDGRAEGYYVDGEFGTDVTVKINAIDLLTRELDPKRKRTPFKRCYIGVGGGVGDSYQPIEQKYQLTRKALELLNKHDFPIHLLTKSSLIERDLDLIKAIHQKNGAIANFSFSSVDDKISSIFEPGVPAPSKRLETISKFKAAGIPCGMFLMPVIPFVTDTEEHLENSIKAAADAKVDFIIFSGMTLKDGRQKECFLEILAKNYPDLGQKYHEIYKANKWGAASKEYYDVINKRFGRLAKKYKVPVRVPPYLFKDKLDENDLVIVILEHIDYLLKLDGKSSPYSYAAYSISKLKEPLSSMKDNLQQLKGVGKFTERIILEILDTGTSKYYESLLPGDI